MPPTTTMAMINVATAQSQRTRASGRAAWLTSGAAMMESALATIESAFISRFPCAQRA